MAQVPRLPSRDLLHFEDSPGLKDSSSRAPSISGWNRGMFRRIDDVVFRRARLESSHSPSQIGRQITNNARCHADFGNSSLNARLKIFPTFVFGRSFLKYTRFGTLYPVSALRQ
jgi:hypothetical protein